MMNESQESQNKGNKFSYVRRHNHLLGKVVLLIGSEAADLQTLVTQLGRKGAHVALVSHRLQLKTLVRIKQYMKCTGQHLLLLERGVGHAVSATDLISTVIDKLGRVDVLIDLSATTRPAVTA